MATSKQLSTNTNQHIPKNSLSKKDDKRIYQAMQNVKEYLNERFQSLEDFQNFYIKLQKEISFEEMIKIIKKKKIRENFVYDFNTRTIKPDGGLLVLRKKEDCFYQKILLVAEVKRQGTNDNREKEGKSKQAIGNAIERLGKNLIGIKAMLNYESITPFVFFGWGCDFEKVHGYIASKVCMMNDFYQLNKTYIWKRDGNTSHNAFAPVSMYFQKEQWEIKEMTSIMKEIAETSLRYYLF